jgi:monoamine oxidase
MPKRQSPIEGGSDNSRTESILTRRDFLRRSVIASTALAAPSRSETEGQDRIGRAESSKKVIIIGAGLAGLSAAFELSRMGHEVTVVESRLRIGGRVYTLREPFSDGMYAEAGAARIPDNHQLTLKYIKLFGLTLDPFEPGALAQVAYIRGRRIKIPAGEEAPLTGLPGALTPEERNGSLAGLWERYVAPVLKEMGNPAATGWPPDSLKKYDLVTFAEFLRQQGTSPDAIALMEMPYYKPEDDMISALWSLREAKLLQAQRRDYKIRGGNDLLPKAFAARLARKIRYGAQVIKIERDASSVSVLCRQGGATNRLTADYLICAIPLTVLRRIEVSPPFSPEKRRVIEQHSYESATRVFLQARGLRWQGDGLSGFGFSDHPEAIWRPTFNQSKGQRANGRMGGRDILVSYLSGAQARQVAAMNEGERISSTLDRFKKIFPGLRENFEGGASFCWDEDEWARGAYSILKPREMFSLLPHVARPEGRVHFAGEHASAWPGWMQGALESGNRAAKEINAATYQPMLG